MPAPRFPIETLTQHERKIFAAGMREAAGVASRDADWTAEKGRDLIRTEGLQSFGLVRESCANPDLCTRGGERAYMTGILAGAVIAREIEREAAKIERGDA